MTINAMINDTHISVYIPANQCFGGSCSRGTNVWNDVTSRRKNLSINVFSKPKIPFIAAFYDPSIFYGEITENNRLGAYYIRVIVDNGSLISRNKQKGNVDLIEKTENGRPSLEIDTEIPESRYFLFFL